MPRFMFDTNIISYTMKHAMALDLVLVTNDYVFEDVPGLHAEFWAIEPGHAYR